MELKDQNVLEIHSNAILCVFLKEKIIWISNLRMNEYKSAR